MRCQDQTKQRLILCIVSAISTVAVKYSISLLQKLSTYKSDYTTSPLHLPQKYKTQQPQCPTFLIAPMTSHSSISAPSSHSASHTNYCALCRVLSYAPTAPAPPPGNPAQSFYIPRSDCGLYYCVLFYPDNSLRPSMPRLC